MSIGLSLRTNPSLSRFSLFTHTVSIWHAYMMYTVCRYGGGAETDGRVEDSFEAAACGASSLCLRLYSGSAPLPEFYLYVGRFTVVQNLRKILDSSLLKILEIFFWMNFGAEKFFYLKFM